LLPLFDSIAFAQESTPSEEFPVATEFGNQTITNTIFYDPFYESGMNTISQRADYETTQQYIENYSVLAANTQNRSDWIHHYTTGYYSKWEAEINAELDRVGMKHRDSLGNLIGNSATWNGRLCWSSVGLPNHRDSLVYGPHYRQDKRYKRWLYEWNQKDSVKYVPRFHMALDNSYRVNSNENVCKIKVIFRYKDNDAIGAHHDIPFIERTLKVGDFDTLGNFDDFYLHPNPDFGWYMYPDEFWLPKNIDLLSDTPSSIPYIDWESYTGIQFCVDWLRDDNLCTLYIDYIEVYDNDGWNVFIDDPDGTATLIKNYADSFNVSSWSNIKYWLGVDEPYSIDCYTPIHIVDSLIQTVNPNSPLIVPFNPTWWHTLNVNGEDEIAMFYNIAKPKRITLSVNPCSDWNDILSFNEIDWLRFNLQRTSALDSNFWFNAQAHGRWDIQNQKWATWRKPTPEELRSMVMLALSHGAKGINFKWFDSFESSGYYWDCIVDENAVPRHDSIYYLIKDNLIPRLKGKLGKTLLTLNYTGDYLELRRYMGPNTAESETKNYLTLSTTPQNPTPFTYYFHAGFFESPNQIDNNHFLLTNLITYDDRWVNVGVTDNGSNYINTRFRNVEPEYGFDTTFTDEFSIDIQFPPGEGYLFQVAPVVKYGGKLIYPETISSTTTLLDEMIIQNGAALTINSTYNADRNITVTESGSIITTSGGTIKFYNGKNLIVEGAATISGTAQNKLVLDFLSPSDSNGIVIKPGGSLNIAYCEIKNAGKGILSELNANYLNAQNVDFINCETHSINIAGRSPGMNPTPPPQIYGCTMLNSNYGIFVTNLSGIIIRDNTITNTDCGVYLSNVTGVQVIDNNIQTNTEEMQGIFASSTGGVIRGNTITGHTTGIHLANASNIDVGGNDVTDCLYHGMYIGAGSNPNMVGRLVLNLGTRKWYATSGYNKIYDNGGYSGGGVDNDGSEIYFHNSNAKMKSGCNSIFDNRQPSPPLVNTLLLMNCPFGQVIIINAQYNFWGDTVYSARFGYLSVDYTHYFSQGCTYPEEGEGDGLVMKTQFGEVIDTVYSTGAEVPELTETELAYAEAEGYFLTGNLSLALQVYDGIIAGIATEEEKYLAYQRKYSIGKLTGQSTEFFDQLSNTFSTLAANSQDSLNTKILNQLSTLSKVGEQEYETAIGEFDGVIQQNPNTEEAVYAEIDALTTALLVEGEDSTLQKGRLGKYLVKTSGDYNQRVDEILRKNFGNKPKETEEKLLPTEYTLYQNYPNPFNPITTIKYDFPNASEVSLIIYDILGRKVKELVNTKQQAGRYEIQFNASNLASGVYIYQLVAEKYMNSKKMILLK
jgi:parallel beta-helix repeat protein